MAAYKLTDFSDIYLAVMEELKLQTSDTTSLNRIKRMVNMIYLDEVVPASRWFWLYGNTSLTHQAYTEQAQSASLHYRQLQPYLSPHPAASAPQEVFLTTTSQ